VQPIRNLRFSDGPSHGANRVSGERVVWGSSRPEKIELWMHVFDILCVRITQITGVVEDLGSGCV